MLRAGRGRDELLLMSLVLVLLTLGLAFANGANDVSKGIATLVGSGTTKYRAAVAWGTAWTLAGGLSAAFFSQGLVATFSGKGFLLNPPEGNALLLSVACGAIGWLLFATVTGLPVSTTHALAGALCGAGIAAAGSSGVAWAAVARKVALPLALSPVLSLVLMLVVSPVVLPIFRRFHRFCVCLERRETVLATAGSARTASLPTVDVVAASDCPPETLVRVGLLDSLHWTSAGATSFFRGLNDTPKILALGIAATAAYGVSAFGFYALVAVAMSLGSFLGGFRVTETLARKVTRIGHDDGLLANLTTSALVSAASFWALPVSTTHVSSGAIIGIGAESKESGLQWRTVREMLLAWAVTLPVAGLLAALTYRVLS
ncbi:MAG TPA: inorganic phosphate transporter [Thermoanaerobaculia bacterium]|nr:inorganic phosphate transporter [Thermoanaerobaculia bacterium]